MMRGRWKLGCKGTSPSVRSRAWAALRQRLLEPAIAVLTVVIGPLLLAGVTRDVVALGSVAMQGGWFWLVAIPCMAVGAFAALGATLAFISFVLPVSGLALSLAAVALVHLVATESGGAGGLIFVLVLAAICLALGIKLTVWVWGRGGRRCSRTRPARDAGRRADDAWGDRAVSSRAVGCRRLTCGERYLVIHSR